MSHNLVITNNKDSEYVEFTVNIPDGYSKFRMEYLNGSLINQNYLKVGDIIKFKFANNPIRYDIPSGKVKLIYGPTEAGKPKVVKDDPTDYKFLRFNVFNYQKLIFIPIFQYYSIGTQQVIYIFNPCEQRFLYDSPTNKVPSEIINRTADPQDNTEVSFSGYFLMAFDKTSLSNLPDQTLVIGESISNSKTRPQEMGSYQLSANVANEVEVNSITVNKYNYGSVWRYSVSNEVLKHTETIAVNWPENVISTLQLIVGRKYPEDHQIHSSRFYNFTPDIIIENVEEPGDNEQVYKGLDSDANPKYYNLLEKYNPIGTYSINTDEAYEPYIIYIGSDNKPHNLGPNWHCTYSALVDNKIQIVTGDLGNEQARIIDPNTTENYLVPGWVYSGNKITIRVVDGTVKKTAQPLRNRTFVIGGSGIRCFRFHKTHYYIDGHTGCYLTVVSGGKFYYDVSWIDHIYLCDGTTTDDNGEITISYSLLSGVTVPLTLKNISETNAHVSTDLLQLTGESDKLNPEDLYVESVLDDNGVRGLDISCKPMSNICHTISITQNLGDNSNSHPWNYTVQNTEVIWEQDDPGTTDKPLKAFIPLKTNEFPDQLEEGTERSGWFIVGDMVGNYTNVLTDNESEVYIAQGHNTLNIEPPTEDDLKFKTFNGTLVFDRSNTKITRLFSNDLTGACLGYLNDLLAAKLSRYYYCCNYNVWNSFLNTNTGLNFTMDPSFLNKIYTDFEFYTGYHETWMSNASDLVKLIGSENVVNNCMSSLQPEEQQYDALVTHNEQYKNGDFPPIDADNYYPTLYYKFFHFYTSGLTDYPYIGTRSWDDRASGILGGLNLMYVPSNKTYDSTVLNNVDVLTDSDVSARVCEKPIYVFSREDANAKSSYIYDHIDDTKRYYDNAELETLGCIETLPAFRIYRNNNFEQPDLTITTGGIKLLHPVYLQSTPRVIVNNILYIFDCIIENLLQLYDKIISDDGVFGYLSVILQIPDDGLVDRTLADYPGSHPLLRFGSTGISDSGEIRYIATSLDSLCLLNYLHMNSLNDYQNIKELKDSLPTAGASNEEVISDIQTNTVETNVQLFSSKYFNFLSEVTQFAMVVFNSMYVEEVPYDVDELSLYWNVRRGESQKNQQLITYLRGVINTYINNSLSYNNIKTCKVFICKLGEFLDFPRILYGGCESFNNTMNVTVWNYDSSSYRSPIRTEYKYISSEDAVGGQWTKIETSDEEHPEQKVNTNLYGIMFRYHQLAHGYQNFPNELTNDYTILKSLGNRTFKVVLYDEFGRRFPNDDTNQGFKNNLYIELSLE